MKKKIVAALLAILILALSTSVLASIIDGDPCPHEYLDESIVDSELTHYPCTDPTHYGCIVYKLRVLYYVTCLQCGAYRGQYWRTAYTHNMPAK